MTPTPDLPACRCGGKAKILSHIVLVDMQSLSCPKCFAATPLFSDYKHAAACWTRMMTEPSSVPACSDREAFEAWAEQADVGFYLQRSPTHGHYLGIMSQGGWLAWTAALAHARQTPDPSAARIAELEGENARLCSDAFQEAVKRYPDSEGALVFYATATSPPGKLTEEDWAWAREAVSRLETSCAALTPTATPPSEARDE